MHYAQPSIKLFKLNEKVTSQNSKILFKLKSNLIISEIKHLLAPYQVSQNNFNFIGILKTLKIKLEKIKAKDFKIILLIYFTYYKIKQKNYLKRSK